MNTYKKNQNIVVCFPAGSGGHLIGALCSILLGNSESYPDENGSMHSSVAHGFIHVNSSLPQDIIIKKLPNKDVIIGHFTNVELLVETGKKVIYITFTPDDINEMVYRANKKTKIDLTDKNTYTQLAGSSWPTYEEFCSGTVIPTGEQNWLANNHQYSYWVYSLPKHKDSTLEIKFSSINDSQTLIDKIANFMSITNYDTGKLQHVLNIYRQLNPGK
jgi:hypothetical protein